eukprot:2807238-Amphidinium_carterae.2
MAKVVPLNAGLHGLHLWHAPLSSPWLEPLRAMPAQFVKQARTTRTDTTAMKAKSILAVDHEACN